jgi:hypothetical protein
LLRGGGGGAATFVPDLKSSSSFTGTGDFTE